MSNTAKIAFLRNYKDVISEHYMKHIVDDMLLTNGIKQELYYYKTTRNLSQRLNACLELLDNEDLRTVHPEIKSYACQSLIDFKAFYNTL